jgi:hypothetical protein
VWIQGKEEADRLAKKGATEVPPNQFTAIPFTVGKENSWNRGIRPGGLPVLVVGSPKR